MVISNHFSMVMIWFIIPINKRLALEFQVVNSLPRCIVLTKKPPFKKAFVQNPLMAGTSAKCWGIPRERGVKQGMTQDDWVVVSKMFRYVHDMS